MRQSAVRESEMALVATIHHDAGLRLGGKVVLRRAARAIVRRGGGIYMLRSSFGDLKFPGGAIEGSESVTDAVARELREECGASLIRVVGNHGTVREYRRAREAGFDVFQMDSHYVVCEIDEHTTEQRLEQCEKRLDLRPVWVALHEALRVNSGLIDSGKAPPWSIRDTAVIRMLASQGVGARAPSHGGCSFGGWTPSCGP